MKSRRLTGHQGAVIMRPLSKLFSEKALETLRGSDRPLRGAGFTREKDFSVEDTLNLAGQESEALVGPRAVFHRSSGWRYAPGLRACSPMSSG
jgi:hypothetical protein